MNLEEFAGLEPSPKEEEESVAPGTIMNLADAIKVLTQPEPVAVRHVVTGAAARRSAQPANGPSTDYVTPPQYMQAALDAMGGIDLDPASSHAARKIALDAGVDILNIFTPTDEEGSGLERDWYGRVFLNPPGGWVVDPATGTRVSGQPMWIRKTINEVAAGRVKQAIILLHADSIRLPEIHPYPICFTNHRIKFMSEDGAVNSRPTNQNIFVYIGTRTEEFIQAFDQFGVIMAELI